jgi:hypothetical protein
MLGARTEQEAMMTWLSSVKPEIQKMARHVSVDIAGPALVSVDNAMSVQLDVHHAVISRDGLARVSTAIRLGLGAIGLVMVGRERWGDDWSHALEAFGHRRHVVEADARPGWEHAPVGCAKPRRPSTVAHRGDRR